MIRPVFILLLAHLFGMSIWSCEPAPVDEKYMGVVMREIGHEVLLAVNDSSSRVLPIEKIEGSYVITFERPVLLDYDSLIRIVSRKLPAAGIDPFIVELKDCRNEEVFLAFAYDGPSDTLAPCRGRDMSESCYRIEITPAREEASSLATLMAIIGLLFIGVVYYLRRQGSSPRSHGDSDVSVVSRSVPMGRYIFQPEERALVLDGRTSRLTEKEAKLLSALVAEPDRTFSREELMAAIWGEEGVQVISRNIDVLISKLRKKLSEDVSILIENVHGVGYKLILRPDES